MKDRDTIVTDALDIIDVGLGVFDRENCLIYSNAAFRDLRGYPQDICHKGAPLAELLTYSALRGDFGPGVPEKLVKKRLDEIAAVKDRRVEHVRPDGQVLQIRYQRKKDGGLVITYRDTTAEHRAEAALRRSEERYALVSEAADEAIYDWDIGAGRFFATPRLDDLLDHSISGLAKPMEAWRDLVHADDLEGYVAAVRAHFRGETEQLEQEYRIRVRGGGYRWVHDRGVAVRDATGRVARLVGAVRDVTETRTAEEQLAATQARLVSSLSSLSDGILMVDAERRVELFNQRYVDIFSSAAGTDATPIIRIGRKFFDMIRDGYDMGMFKPHPDGADAWVENRLKAWDSPVSQWELELANGSWILLNEREMPDGGRISIYTDITEIKRREAEAEAARQRFEEAIEAIGSGFALWDSEDRLVISNSRYRAFFEGLADMVVPGKAFNDIIAAGIQRDMFPLARGDVAGYLARIAERRLVADGSVREQFINRHWLQITDHRTQDGGIVSIYTDITERKLAEDRLRAALSEFNAVSEHIDYGILFTGPDLRARIVNRAFRELWEMDQEFIDTCPHMQELIEYNRKTGLYSVSEEEWDEWLAERISSIKAGNVPPREFERGDGKFLRYQVVNLPDGGRMLTYFDITELKARENEASRARDKAETALADLKKAQERLVQSEKMASLGQLTAGIAHEIKNPLNFVNNFSKLSAEMLEELEEVLEEPVKALAEDDRDEAEDLLKTVRENLLKIARHGQRADAIVKNMLLHSRDGPGERQSVGLNAIAEEAMNLAYHAARAEDKSFNIEMVKQLDADLGEVVCYPQDLMRVFLNLVTNGMYAAVKHRETAASGFEPRITLTTKVRGDMAEVQVCDNGAGIPEDVREKIFLPFFTTKPAGEGTGLGLSLSYDIVVKQHGGALTVDSAPRKYTRFTVSIPMSGATG
ncbi:PAS domain S-box-containing protein [Ruegeria marina]|uniref:histidine kinase n=2 Tax=Ruegeria marina TaxID=639004 RepID=A0A1G6VU75_9RHOB|nr:PAS domain S-box-containing protein [Ruegeria marina]